VPFVTGLCFVMFAVTLITGGVRMSGGLLGFLSPSCLSVVRFGGAGALPVFYEGRWWTLLSAGWLHGGLLHIAFNVMWIRQLAPDVGELYGLAGWSSSTRSPGSSVLPSVHWPASI
jgi:rhomboid protease GluP